MEKHDDMRADIKTIAMVHNFLVKGDWIGLREYYKKRCPWLDNKSINQILADYRE